MPRESRPPHLPGGSPSNGVALLKQRLQMRQQSTLKTNWAKLCTLPRTLSQSSEGRILTQVTHGHRDGTRPAQCLDDQRAREGTHSITGIALHGPPAPNAPGCLQRWQATPHADGRSAGGPGPHLPGTRLASRSAFTPTTAPSFASAERGRDRWQAGERGARPSLGHHASPPKLPTQRPHTAAHTGPTKEPGLHRQASPGGGTGSGQDGALALVSHTARHEHRPRRAPAGPVSLPQALSLEQSI